MASRSELAIVAAVTASAAAVGGFLGAMLYFGDGRDLGTPADWAAALVTGGGLYYAGRALRAQHAQAQADAASRAAEQLDASEQRAHAVKVEFVKYATPGDGMGPPHSRVVNGGPARIFSVEVTWGAWTDDGRLELGRHVIDQLASGEPWQTGVLDLDGAPKYWCEVAFTVLGHRWRRGADGSLDPEP